MAVICVSVWGSFLVGVHFMAPGTFENASHFDCLYFTFYFVLIHLFSFVFPISRFFSPSASLYFNTNKRFIHSFVRFGSNKKTWIRAYGLCIIRIQTVSERYRKKLINVLCFGMRREIDRDLCSYKIRQGRFALTQAKSHSITHIMLA